MFEFFNALSDSDKINFAFAFFNALASCVAIFISLASLHQTSKSIQSANRPYLGIYATAINVGSAPDTYIVFKNFGSSAMKLESISCNESFEDDTKLKKDFVQLMNGTVFAPGQAFPMWIDLSKHKKQIVFNVKYRAISSNKVYSERADLNLNATVNPVTLTHNPPANSDSSEYLKYISLIMQDYSKKHL